MAGITTYYVRLRDVQRRAYRYGHDRIARRLGNRLAELRHDFPHLQRLA